MTHCRLILMTSRGRRTISPIPVRLPGRNKRVSAVWVREHGVGDEAYDPAVAAIMALPFFSPNALVKEDLKFLARKSLK